VARRRHRLELFVHVFKSHLACDPPQLKRPRRAVSVFRNDYFDKIAIGGGIAM
jgi:hypothetical protein